jgi:hypothetical protein
MRVNMHGRKGNLNKETRKFLQLGKREEKGVEY